MPWCDWNNLAAHAYDGVNTEVIPEMRALLTGLVLSFALSPAAAQAGEGTWSPFEVALHGHPAFSVVSFKVYGQAAAPEAQEMVADALALALRVRDRLSTEVVYAAELMSPAAHRYCEPAHLYIDLWPEDGDGRWGFSLWSGCSEEDLFARAKLASPAADLAGQLVDVAGRIDRSIRAADARACYVRAC